MVVDVRAGVALSAGTCGVLLRLLRPWLQRIAVLVCCVGAGDQLVVDLIETRRYRVRYRVQTILAVCMALHCDTDLPW